MACSISGRRKAGAWSDLGWDSLVRIDPVHSVVVGPQGNWENICFCKSVRQLRERNIVGGG